MAEYEDNYDFNIAPAGGGAAPAHLGFNGAASIKKNKKLNGGEGVFMWKINGNLGKLKLWIFGSTWRVLESTRFRSFSFIAIKCRGTLYTGSPRRLGEISDLCGLFVTFGDSWKEFGRFCMIWCKENSHIRRVVVVVGLTR